MPHQFQHNIGVAINTWELTLLRELMKDFIHIGHVEITTETKIFCFPIVSAQKRMHIGYAALTRCAVTKMSHIKLTGERKIFLCIFYIGQILSFNTCIAVVYLTENLCDSIRPFSTLPKHIFRTCFRIKLDTCHPSSFLSTIVLLLHHQIKFV